MAPQTKKEIAKSIKTLIVMLQSLREQQVTVTLRNDTIVRGIIIKVDACMNIELKDATVEVDKFYCIESQSLDTKSQDDIYEKGDEHLLDIENHTNQTRASVDMAGDSSCCGSGEEDIYGTHSDEDNDDAATDYDDDTHQQTATTCNKYFLVKGSRIRHIDLPNDSDLVAGAKYEIQRLRNRSKQWNKRDIVRPVSNLGGT